MVRADWPKLAAIGLALAGLAVIVTAGWLIYRGAELQRSNEKETSEQTKGAYDRARIQVDRDCRPLPSPRQKQCEQQIQDAYEEDRREIEDLEAQRATATWTAYMAAAALVGMAVGIVGVGLVFFTFQQTRRQAQAAHEANRAWLRLQVGEKEEKGSLWIKPDVLEFSAPLILTNYGKSPALDVWSDGFITFDRPSLNDVLGHIKNAAPEERHGRTILFPAVSEGTQIEFIRIGDRPESAPVFVTVFVKYKVVGDRKWHHTAQIFTTRPGDSATIFYGTDGDNLRLNYGDIHQGISLTLHRGKGGLPVAS